MKTPKEKIGAQGEKLARKYLKRKGYRILDTNVRKTWGELDIVAKAPDKTLVFVEVKTTQSSDGVQPEEQMTSAKVRKFQRAASLYAGSHQDLIDDRRGWRLDVITVFLDREEVRHYENI